MKRWAAAHTEIDPREPWELEVDEHTARAQAPSGLRGFPYRPRRAEDVPEGALAELKAAVRAGDIQDLLVVPCQARPAHGGRSGRQLLTPVTVLGAGPGGVALWVGAPARPGVRVVVPAEQVAAVETMHILLYARLTILAADARLSLRYNAVAAHDVQPLIRALRHRIARTSRGALPRNRVPAAELPYKWRRLLASDAVRLEGGEPVVVVAGSLPVPRRAEPAYGAVALTARELIVLVDPVHAERGGGRYGVDAHHIPRSRIEDLCADGPLLRVRSCGADLQLPLGEEVSGQAVQAFARYVPSAGVRQPEGQ
jgi:hypothetical protein